MEYTIFFIDRLYRGSHLDASQKMRAQVGILLRSPQIQGTTPWILKDFRAMLRTHPKYQQFFNRKGLIDPDGNRKLAFVVLADFYAGDWP